MRKKILVVNPPVLSPMPLAAMEGLMGPYVLASRLRAEGRNADIFDFIQEPRQLDGFRDIRVEGVKKCGNFEEERFSKRIYYQGLSEEKYINFLKAYKPHEVRISALFTFYWQGAKIVYELTREFNSLIKIRLGGAYPLLTTEHAIKHFPDAEIILFRPDDTTRFRNIDISLYRKIPRMFPVLTSVGCPYKCKWCAVPLLEGSNMKFKDPGMVANDIEEKFYYGVKTFRFLDSHLLSDYECHFKVILQELIKRNIKAEFYSYGGLNPLFVTQEMLELMARAGFSRIQLPIETVNSETLKKNNRPVTVKAWLSCVEKLKKINMFEVVSYLLCGVPGQSIKEVYGTINFLEDNGVTPAPLFFTPIPATSYEDKRPLEDLHPFLFPCASSECPAGELEKICLNYHSTGEKLVSDMVRGDKHMYESGPSLPIGERQ